ncbi:glycerol-3-phosphate 1-O-acyltransferase PlsY [Bacillus carboniphilus]|uniref:Glycerol-3-phosphate acyltransferase n=1 Tax=Bacillus carboniphilus TaxID=86663 RepID=A0ABY9JVM7_9BACI|nr:glycerol-3-phosphate 1-O-acyltransferase PlsY [Bacillus carboniphilus]WLR43435.1 glycerol-3-phosphate 1-O-acyltransferase PlsY [Bacillus carboniphilus]
MFYIMIILAYVIGSIPFGLIVGKVGYGIDIREHGSGNLGGTNTFRTLGVTAGLIVTIADILKGTLAACLPLLLTIDGHPSIYLGVAAAIGHSFPIFAKFKGGKAVATSSGVVLAIEPFLFLFAIICFFIILYISKMVSFSSIVCSVLAFIYTLIFVEDLTFDILIGLLAAFIIYRHRQNIVRIKNKTEPKIKWM